MIVDIWLRSVKMFYKVIIDRDDYKAVRAKDYKMYIRRNKKGRCYVYLADSKGKSMGGLHIFLMKPPKGLIVDHKNGDGLDNSRSNLRIATKAQNGQNKTKRKGTSSQYKGVCLHKSGKWVAAIVVNGKRVHLGCYAAEQEAARAYDAAATTHFGEFAFTNAMLGLCV